MESYVKTPLRKGCALEIHAELDLHRISAAKIAASIVPTELLLVGCHVPVNGCSDHVENVRRRANIKVHLQGS